MMTEREFDLACRRELGERTGQPVETLAEKAARLEAEQAQDDEIVIEVTEAEFTAAARRALADLGITYAELEDMARRRDFTSAQAHVLWVSIGGTVRL